MNNKINNKLNIKYIGSNKSYTYSNIRFENGKPISVDEQLAKKLLATGEFISLDGDNNESREKSI